VLRWLLQSDIRYIGLLGPRRRRDQILASLASEGFNASSAQLARLHNPIGLDIGAETPEEIAISIVAEIQATIGQRNGMFLRDRDGAIHTRI
jgi:xanthine/CO dehydrogenase XdhC/CoxF family maturation factor